MALIESKTIEKLWLRSSWLRTEIKMYFSISREEIMKLALRNRAAIKPKKLWNFVSVYVNRIKIYKIMWMEIEEGRTVSLEKRWAISEGKNVCGRINGWESIEEM